MNLVRARICAVHRASVHLRFNGSEITATLDPALARSSDPLALPTVGDWVLLDDLPDARSSHARVRAVEPRHSLLMRRAAGTVGAPQLLAANVDTALLFSPFPTPPNVNRLARLAAVAVGGEVTPVVVLSRSDTVSAQEIALALDAVHDFLPDVPVVVTSAMDDDGLQSLLPWLWPGATLVLLGPSGAGKSSLLNRLAGRSLMATGELRGDGAGRHTTTHRALLELDSGVTVIDTPGLREVGLWSAPAASDAIFADITALGSTCRFADCSHIHEPGCAVRAAVNEGAVDADRAAQWYQLRREAEAAERSQSERKRRERSGSLAMRRLKPKGG